MTIKKKKKKKYYGHHKISSDNVLSEMCDVMWCKNNKRLSK